MKVFEEGNGLGAGMREALEYHSIYILVDNILKASGLFRPNPDRPHNIFSMFFMHRVATQDNINSAVREMEQCKAELISHILEAMLEGIGYCKRELKFEEKKLRKIRDSKFRTRHCPSNMPEIGEVDVAYTHCSECVRIYKNLKGNHVSPAEMWTEFAKFERLISNIRGLTSQIVDASLTTEGNLRGYWRIRAMITIGVLTLGVGGAALVVAL